MALRIHFEDWTAKPDVFRLTRAVVKRAAERNRKRLRDVELSTGSDLRSTRGLCAADGLVTSNDVLVDPKFPLRQLAKDAPKLRWIHIIGAGVEPLMPLDWLPGKVWLTNNSGVHVEKVAEFASMALLMLNARLPAIVSNGREHQWSQVFTGLIREKVAVVVGLGNLGGTVARQAKRLGLRVIGVRRKAAAHRWADEVVATEELARVLPRADFVIVAAPLTEQTRGLLSATMLRRVKRGAGLVNIGRAQIVDNTALIAALNDGRLSGAIVDVFEQEPLPADSPLWTARNLILLPHVSSDDADSYIDRTLDLACENTARLVSGRRLKNVVDRHAQY